MINNNVQKIALKCIREHQCTKIDINVYFCTLMYIFVHSKKIKCIKNQGKNFGVVKSLLLIPSLIPSLPCSLNRSELI